ncbi:MULTISPECIES: hypothetical protein [Pseudomonas]|uniref:hypothetical protein n=1 Tax=Pseudomonas TaxID=286 RepID=UPI000F78ECC4|nr:MULTISPECIES: hypothetical protein [Pseudomonas]MDH0959164.1 hypothetical protein [Pseudomonas chengduensis]MDH1933322.1 hypothetical protein [Pseudomonas sp. GD03696]MDV5863545.1 hypothetical protein [Pseudomonas mendocina]RRV30568.1 hypothetical protein EGJ86_21090 [Pseudomonas sp. o96-267]
MSTQLRAIDDPAVHDAIERAASAACSQLDALFPGCDRGGIGSNFQALLGQCIGHMLQGGSLLDQQRGHRIALRQLVASSTMFGDPRMPGNAFLVVRDDDAHPWLTSRPETLALCLDTNRFRPLSQIGDAWTSFDAAAKAALAYCQGQGMTLEETKRLGLQVRAVTNNANANATGLQPVAALQPVQAAG